MKTFNFKPERIYIVFNNNVIFIGDFEKLSLLPTISTVEMYRNILNNDFLFVSEIVHYLYVNTILFISHSKEEFEKYLTKHKKELV